MRYFRGQTGGRFPIRIPKTKEMARKRDATVNTLPAFETADDIPKRIVAAVMLQLPPNKRLNLGRRNWRTRWNDLCQTNPHLRELAFATLRREE